MIQTLLNNTESKSIIQSLEADGAVIINDMLDMHSLNLLESECNDTLKQRRNCNGYFFGFETKRVGSMVGKSKSCRDMATNSLILKVMDHFLLPHCSQYQLNLSQLISIGSGEKSQIIHADDPMFPFPHDNDMQVMINVMWAIDDFTEENGATNVITGSHLWDRDRHPTGDDTIEPAVMKKGSCLIWLGSARHGGGANKTLTSRRGVVISYNLGWLKSSDNHFLSISKEDTMSYPRKLQELLGYFVHKPNLNMVDGGDPIEVLQSDNDNDRTFLEFLPEGVESVLKEHYSSQSGSISEVKFK
ncbi:MAG: ectoine hydroxylase-related dioxygenase (phytanoyl-CoA dioxygenase family) [Alphaproteobacteria bacterium]|jgi:ectoine hydroxylase-related dioxygenase (phytanoyl-CoA dioxygenase family)